MVELLHHNLNRIKELFSDVLEIKKNHASQEEVKKSKITLMFVALKNSNRTVKYKIRDGREHLYLEKSKADVNRLHLQNLLYEINHLKREIIGCHKFKSRDCNINILTEEEYANLGVALSNYDTITPHGKRLLHLKYELNLRKELSFNYKTLLSSKQQLLQEILFKNERYTSFSPALQTLQQATKPLHDALQMKLNDEWKLLTVVEFLPQPLYLFYMNLKTIKNVENFNFTVEIVGSESEVMRKQIENENSLVEKMVSKPNQISNSTAGLSIEPHPLSIRFTIEMESSLDNITINVFFFESLRFATAQAVLSSKETSDIELEFPSTQNILAHLYNNDLGNEIPITNIFKLQNRTVSVEHIDKHIDFKKYGKPYCWLQKLCPNSTLWNFKTKKSDTYLLQRAHKLLIKIRRRWLSWLQLIQQIRGLSYKDIDTYGIKENIYPCELSCSLVQWASISSDEFDNHKPDSGGFLKNNSDEIYSFFRAVIVRGSAKMECFIRISSSYPLDTPLWIICVHWNGQHTSFTSTSIKMMEYWTNVLAITKSASTSGLLYAQLFRTMYSFDIFLETEGSLQSSVEYVKEKPYIRAFAKRIRLRPYKFIKKGTVFAFKQ